MKRNALKGICLLLCAILAFSSLSGCDNRADKENSLPQQKKQNVKPSFSYTDYDLVINGKSDYCILIPEKPSANESFAAEELQMFVQKATGVKLPIKQETNAVQDPFLSLGMTKAAKSAGVAPTYETVKTNGFVMKTVNNSLYMSGFNSIGTRNSVYEFLYYCFDYECYAADEIYLNKTESVKLPDFDLTVNPTFDWRNVTCGEYIVDPTTTARMRLTSNDEKFVTGALCHNSMTVIDPSVYDYNSKKYKAWYSDAQAVDPLDPKQNMRPAQLCFSNSEMTAEFIKNLMPMLVENEAPIFLLGMEDNVEWCTCKDCAASKQKYGTDAAVMIKFANQVQRAINQYFEKELPNRTPTKIIFFAYYSTVQPPVRLNESTKKYEPIDDSVKLDPDVGIMYAPINAGFGVPLTDTMNKNYADYIEGWSVLTDNIHIWIYNLHTSDGLILHDTCETMQPNYRYLAEHNAVGILDQMDSYQSGGNTSWTRARAFVGAKLRWNVDLNIDELYQDFFNNYFDEASATMYDLFMREREWISYIYQSTSLSGKINERMNTAEYWSYPWLQTAMEQINQAYKDIEPIRQKDFERYVVLNNRIALESLQFRFLLIQVFGTEFSAKELYDMKLSFKKDFERLGLISFAEHHNINELWTDWGIN